MIPVDLWRLTKSWSYRSSAQETGFRADSARVIFGPIDPATFLAVADYINNADDTDSFDIIVGVGVPLQPFLVFRGVVQAWELEETYEEGKKTFNAVMEAADDRVKLFRKPDSHLMYRGVSVVDSLRTTNSTAKGVIEHMAALASVPIVVESGDYSISTPLLSTGWTFAKMVSWLMQPQQRARSQRWDLIRDGTRYVLRKRPLVLGAADVTIPAGVVRLRRWRRERPRQADDFFKPGDQFDSLQPVMDRTDGVAGRSPESPLDTWGFRTEHIVLPDGFIDRTYQDGRLTYELVDRTIISEESGGEQAHVVRVLNVDFDVKGNMTGHSATTNWGGIEYLRETYRVHRNLQGRIVAHSTITLGRALSNVRAFINATAALQPIRLVESKYESVGRAGGGTFKTSGRDRVNGKQVDSDPSVYELSPGDSFSQDDRDGNSPFGPIWSVTLPGPSDNPLMQEPTDLQGVSDEIAAQEDRDHITVTFEMPWWSPLQAGKTIEFLDSPMDVNVFYVTGVGAEWDEQSGHVVTVEAETWV